MSIDFLDEVFPSDEAIMEVMSLDDPPWDEFHQRDSVYHKNKLCTYPLQILSIDYPEIVPSPFTTIHEIDAEGNLGNLSKTILIDILIKTCVMENI